MLNCVRSPRQLAATNVIRGRENVPALRPRDYNMETFQQRKHSAIVFIALYLIALLCIVLYCTIDSSTSAGPNESEEPACGLNQTCIVPSHYSICHYYRANKNIPRGQITQQ